MDESGTCRLIIAAPRGSLKVELVATPRGIVRLDPLFAEQKQTLFKSDRQRHIGKKRKKSGHCLVTRSHYHIPPWLYGLDRPYGRHGAGTPARRRTRNSDMTGGGYLFKDRDRVYMTKLLRIACNLCP